MTHKQWYKKNFTKIFGQEMGTKDAWNACKNEILKILREKTPESQCLLYTLEKSGLLKRIKDL